MHSSFFKKIVTLKSTLNSESNFYYCNTCGTKTFGKPPHMYIDCVNCRINKRNLDSCNFDKTMESTSRKTQAVATIGNHEQLSVVGTSFYKGALLDLNDNGIYIADLVEFKFQGEFAVAVFINSVRVGSISKSSLATVRKYFIRDINKIKVLIRNKCTYPYITHLYEENITGCEITQYKEMDEIVDYVHDECSQCLEHMPQLYPEEPYQDEPEFDSHADYDDHHTEY